MERNPNYVYYKKMANDIKTIAKNYFIALKRKRIFGENLKEPASVESDFERHIRKVNRAYEQLDELEKTFINNDFFYQNYPNWWKETFSKTSYYRLRRQSMRHFMELFNNEL